MRVLVTGGAGFIGANLAEFHLSRGDSVLAVDDLTTGSAANVTPFAANSLYCFEKADILDWPGLEAAIASADRIYHMAAVVGMFRVLKQPVNVTRVNVMGTERILELAARQAHPPKVVIASSSSVYATSNPVRLSEEIDLNIHPGAALLNYALSKLTNEIQALAYAKEHGLPVVVARLFNTVGPRQSGTYGFVLPRFVEQALAGRPITVFGDGSQTRSFCDVRDTVRMLNALCDQPAANAEVVNVGNDRQITIGELALIVRQAANSNSPIENVSTEKAYGQDFKEIQFRRPVLDKLRRLTGFAHEWNLEDTVNDLVRRQRDGRAERLAAAE
jgi:UDP-glucose 4-epimerase